MWALEILLQHRRSRTLRQSSSRKQFSDITLRKFGHMAWRLSVCLRTPLQGLGNAKTLTSESFVVHIYVASACFVLGTLPCMYPSAQASTCNHQSQAQRYECHDHVSGRFLYNALLVLGKGSRQIGDRTGNLLRHYGCHRAERWQAYHVGAARGTKTI